MAGGVCFHLGWSGEGAPALFAIVVLKARTALGFVAVWRRVLAQDAQTYGAREVDMAVGGRMAIGSFPGDGQSRASPWGGSQFPFAAGGLPRAAGLGGAAVSRRRRE